MVESEIDTDSISLTSTVESEHGPDDEFNVEEIMSEHGSANKKRYLIRWEGYALHKATWEPKENVLGLAALADWIELRQSMTKDNLQIYKKQREAEWDRARKREDRAKEIRRQKRRKKRMNLKQKSKRQPLPSDSEEDIPLNVRKPKISETITSKQQTLPPTSSDGSRQYSSLFEDSQEATHPTPSRAADADDELFVKQGPVAKRPPLEQSSSDEDNDELGDPSLDKASRDANDASPQLPDQQSQKDVAPNLGNSLLAPKGSHRGAAVPTLQVTEKQHQLATNGQNGTQSEQPHAAPLESVETEGAVSKKTTPHLKTPMTQPPTKSTGLVNSSMTANPVGTREGSTPHLKTPIAQPPAKCTGQIINTPKLADPIRTWEGSSSYVSPTYAANTGPQPRPGAAVILPTSQPKTVASTSAVGTAASKSGVPTVLPSDKQNNMGSLNTSGIRIINEDKKKRKEWQNSDKPYNTLKARYHAVKRSHKEGTPDLHALEFVNGAPADLQKQKPRTPTDNPYGRREIVNPRFQEPVVDEPPKKTFEPLREWELNKIPEVCREWRLSKNCKYGPQRCKFMHRDQDQYGNDYKISDAFGRVQPKYRDPPLTCDFWFTSPHGCTKSQEKCEYAHWNTGFKPKDALYRDQIIKINPSLPPAFQENPLPPAFMEAPSVTESRPFHSKVPAEAVTCYFWATSTCHNEDNQCKYQHRHTGVVAPAPPSRKNSDIANQAFSIQPMQSSAMKPSRSQADNAEMAPNEPKSVVEKVAPGTAQVPNGDGEVPADQIINAEIGPNEPKKTHEKATPGTVQVPSTDGDVPLVRTAVIEQSPVHPQQTELPPATLSCLRLEKRIREALKIDIDVLFQTNGEQRSQMSCRKAMLLFHPTSHSVELEVLTRWLLMHHVEVSNAFSDGCWELFREHIGNSGCDIIIAHPDFELFSELPGFGQVLQKRVRLWSLGQQMISEDDPATPTAVPALQQQCVEIFPVGGLIYITDDVFEKEPQLALRIMILFLNRMSGLLGFDLPNASMQDLKNVHLVWRLCVRPELMEYLYDRCEEQAKELDAGEENATARADVYTYLNEKNCIEQDGSVRDVAFDNFAILSEQRDVAEVEFIDYFNALSRSQEEANHTMIRYYALTQIDMRRKYRHFYVVHTEPSAPCVGGWKQEIQSIADVLSPEVCIQELEKEGNGRGCFAFR